jgi:ABC-type multidrug transport system ATPase subunit
MSRTQTRADHGADRTTPAIEVVDVSRRFGDKQALRSVTLRVMPGQTHALLGPNGAGKTTLLRILSGLATLDTGEVRTLGSLGLKPMTRDARATLGLVPSGDRSFYLRLSGLENLVFFGRLYGVSRRHALERSWELLRWVELDDAARQPVGEYSHGMQKRLAIARGLLMEPPILLVDEATHDLDPEAASRVRGLVSDARDSGTAVIWATQRLDEIRGFADMVTVLHEGRVRFAGTVPELLATTRPRRHVVQIRPSDGAAHQVTATALQGLAWLDPDREESEHILIVLEETATLGSAIAALTLAGLEVLSCREERSEIESAFLALIRRDTAR